MLASEKISALGRAIDSPQHPLNEDFARQILQWKISAEDHQRMDALIAKSRSVGLDPEESAAFDELCATADFLSILHLHAREFLGEFNNPGA